VLNIVLWVFGGLMLLVVIIDIILYLWL
jgi:hypothetical protein